MQNGQPSRTALVAAAMRAAHQSVDGGTIFNDPHARALLGPEADALIAAVTADPATQPMRVFMAARSRFAEDCLSEAIARGVRQAVIMGAGLDTFSLRNPHHSAGLRVFEIDHPATQSWKRERLAQAGFEPPPWLTFAPVDFEHGTLADGLAVAGFRSDQPAFFIWLGVVPYLRREAIFDALRFIASVPDAEVVFDYTEPLENYEPERRAGAAAVAARAASVGEPWLTYFDPPELAQALKAAGFPAQHDLGLADIAIRYFGATEQTAVRDVGPHIMHARRNC